MAPDPRRPTPCQLRPRDWDETATAATKARAAAACTQQCHRLAECSQLAAQLGHEIGGVIGGRILPRDWRRSHPGNYPSRLRAKQAAATAQPPN
jgi:hypothetical protein